MVLWRYPAEELFILCVSKALSPSLALAVGDTEFKPDLFGSFACNLRYLSVLGTDFLSASLIFY